VLIIYVMINNRESTDGPFPTLVTVQGSLSTLPLDLWLQYPGGMYGAFICKVRVLNRKFEEDIVNQDS